MQVEAALQFGAAEFVFKWIIYVLHERLWARINQLQ